MSGAPMFPGGAPLPPRPPGIAPMPPMPPGFKAPNIPMPPMPPGYKAPALSTPPMPPGMVRPPVDGSRFPMPPGGIPGQPLMQQNFRPQPHPGAPRSGDNVQSYNDGRQLPYAPPHQPYPAPGGPYQHAPPGGMGGGYNGGGGHEANSRGERQMPGGYGRGGGRYGPRTHHRRFEDEPMQLREPTNTVWIGNLHPTQHTEDVLRRELREFGKVMRIAKQTEKSYCFVHFRRVEEAKAAVETLSQRGTLGQAAFNYGKMFEYTAEEMAIPYDPDYRPPRLSRGDDGADDDRGDRPPRRPRGEREQMEPTNVLWVGSLPPFITDEQLREVFEAFGTVTLVSRMDKGGMAFVHFDTVEHCTLALQTMTGRPIENGVVLALNYGHAQRSKTEMTPEGISANEVPTNVVYLGQLPADTTDKCLEDLFSPFEGFINAKHIASNNIAFGHFDTIDHARTCRIALNNATVNGMPIRVNFGKQNHNLTMADRREAGSIPLDLDSMMRHPSDLNGSTGALVAGAVPGAPGGTGALTLPAMGEMGSALSAPSITTVFTRERPVPQLTLDARLYSILGTTYNGCGAKDLELSPSQVQAICTMVDDCVGEESEQRLDEALTLYAPVKAVHVFSCVAKRLHDCYNDDPHKKLLVLYAATRVVLGVATDRVKFTEAAFNAYIMVLLVASGRQTSSGVDRLSSIIESLLHHSFVEVKGNVGPEYVSALRAELEEILSRAKAEQDLSSLLTRKRRR